VCLLHMHDSGGAGADDGGLGVAAEGRLQDASQLGVAVRDVAACGTGGTYSKEQKVESSRR
jgi:hypothetical protein